MASLTQAFDSRWHQHRGQPPWYLLLAASAHQVEVSQWNAKCTTIKTTRLEAGTHRLVVLEGPQEDMSKSPEPVRVTLFEIRVSAEVNKSKTSRWDDPGCRVVTSSVDSIRREDAEPEGRRWCEGEGIDRSGASRNQEHRGRLPCTRRREKGMELILPPDPPKASNPTHTPTVDCFCPELWKHTFLLFKASWFVAIYPSPKKLRQVLNYFTTF